MRRTYHHVISATEPSIYYINKYRMQPGQIGQTGQTDYFTGAAHVARFCFWFFLRGLVDCMQHTRSLQDGSQLTMIMSFQNYDNTPHVTCV